MLYNINYDWKRLQKSIFLPKVDFKFFFVSGYLSRRLKGNSQKRPERSAGYLRSMHVSQQNLGSAAGVKINLTTPQMQFVSNMPLPAPDRMVQKYQVMLMQWVSKSSACTTLARCDFSPFNMNGLKSHCTELHVNLVFVSRCKPLFTSLNYGQNCHHLHAIPRPCRMRNPLLFFFFL